LFEIAIIREYADVGCPARFEQQTELQHLLDELWRDRDAAFVVVWDYARLARDLTQLNDVVRRIHGCGAEVATLTGIRAAQRYVEEQHNAEQEG
jgi:DNA invertase Pin-like site-specific DNA recombinase